MEPLGARRRTYRLGGALRGLAAALLVAVLSPGVSALDIEAHPVADGFRPGRWAPIRLVLSTQAEPFTGEVVLRVGSAQVHRVPLSLPAHARREVTVGILPFRPSERVEVEAGDPGKASSLGRLTIDLRVAAGPLLAAEAALLETAKRERGAGVVAVGEEDSALWEGFDEVLVSRETAMNRWLLPIDGDRAWVRPVERPWGLFWATDGEARRAGIPSVQGSWVRLWPGTPWGRSARRWFLGAAAGIVIALAAGLLATRRSLPRPRGIVVGALVLVSTAVAAYGPTARPALSALSVIGPTPGNRWQERGFGCASRGNRGDVEVSLPGVPRPVFADLEEAQEFAWGVVWEQETRRARLIFPNREAGQGCWFEWQHTAEVPRYMVPLRSGGAANEIGWTFSPAVLLVDGRATVRPSLGAEESISPGPGDPLPAPLTPGLLGSLGAGWRRGRHFLGRTGGLPAGPRDVDWVDGQTWIWAPLD